MASVSSLRFDRRACFRFACFCFARSGHSRPFACFARLARVVCCPCFACFDCLLCRFACLRLLVSHGMGELVRTRHATPCRAQTLGRMPWSRRVRDRRVGCMRGRCHASRSHDRGSGACAGESHKWQAVACHHGFYNVIRFCLRFSNVSEFQTFLGKGVISISLAYFSFSFSFTIGNT